MSKNRKIASKTLSIGNLFIGCFDYHQDGNVYNMYIVVNNSICEKAKETLTFRKSMAFTKIHRDKKEVIGGNTHNISIYS